MDTGRPLPSRLERAILRKAFAITCIVVVLGAQARVLFPRGARPHEWHWPFLDYPMYSSAHHLGDSLIRNELRAVPCDRPDSTIALSVTALHIDLGRYWALLDQLARSPTAQAHAESLRPLLEAATDARLCSLELWRQIFVVERSGVGTDDRPWVRFRRWPLAPDSTARPAP